MNLKGLSAVFAGLAICMLGLLVIHGLTKTYQRSAQDQFSAELLSHAELVSSQLMYAIEEAKEKGISECTAESIDQLRVIANQYLYVHDLGVVAADAVVCTANWGIFNPPAPLPNDFYQGAFNYQLYPKAEAIFPIRQYLDITRLGQVLAFTVDFSFKQFLARDNGFSYSIEMEDRSHSFLNFQSKQQGVTILDTSNVGLLNVNTAHCSRYFGYCVFTENNRGGLLYFSAPVLFLLFALTLGIGFLVAYSGQSFLYKKNSMEFRLRRAVQRKFVYLEYQPILQANTGQIIGVESLVRWRDTIYGRVSPELLISIAENIGIYGDLTYHIAATSIDEMAPALKSNPAFSLSINVSSFEIGDDCYLLFLKEKTDHHGIPTSQIKIEITEKISASLATLAKFSQRAKQYGFRVSLDDFGTGVANLVWLTEIAFDDIKIDRTFTQALNDTFKERMVLSIMEMVASLHKQVIFEGVETQGELDVILDRFPTAYVQGWFFYKSLSQKSLFKVLQSHDFKIPTPAPSKSGVGLFQKGEVK